MAEECDKNELAEHCVHHEADEGPSQNALVLLPFCCGRGEGLFNYVVHAQVNLITVKNEVG